MENKKPTFFSFGVMQTNISSITFSVFRRGLGTFIKKAQENGEGKKRMKTNWQ